MKYLLNCVNIFKCIKVLLVTSFLLVYTSGCSNFFFFPDHKEYFNLKDEGILYEDIYFDTPDGETLHAWWLPVKSVKELKGSIYYLHGNAENISSHVQQVAWLTQAGYQVFLLDYRGYGKSTGTPRLPEVFIDINSGFIQLNKLLEKQRNDSSREPKPIVLLGQSLGAAMGGYMAATQINMKNSLSAVVLDSPFASYRQVSKEFAAKHWLTWAFQYPIEWGMPSDYELVDYIDDISPIPLMIMHSKDDQVIGVHHSDTLFVKAKFPKQYYQYSGRHINALLYGVHRNVLLNFLNSLSREKS